MVFDAYYRHKNTVRFPDYAKVIKTGTAADFYTGYTTKKDCWLYCNMRGVNNYALKIFIDNVDVLGDLENAKGTVITIPIKRGQTIRFEYGTYVPRIDVRLYGVML